MKGNIINMHEDVKRKKIRTPFGTLTEGDDVYAILNPFGQFIEDVVEKDSVTTDSDNNPDISNNATTIPNYGDFSILN